MAATLLGLRQAPVVSRHPQMVPAVGAPWHRGVTAKLLHDLVYIAKRPAALAVIEFKQRAAPHCRGWHGGIYRWCRFCRHDRCDRCRGATRSRLHRFHLEMFLHAGWQHVTAAQPHCLTAYRCARAVQPPRDLRGGCIRPKADEQRYFLGSPRHHLGTSPASWCSDEIRPLV